ALCTLSLHAALPIFGAKLDFRSATGYPVTADFDWRQDGPQIWDITVRTDAGTLALTAGGASLTIDGQKQLSGPDIEYEAIYTHRSEEHTSELQSREN